MSWLLKFFNSSIGQKIIMSLTGLFLCSFLLVHCAGNLLLFMNDDGVQFNDYAHFMTEFPLIKAISYGLYLMIVVHMVKGLLISYYNYKARGPVSYNKFSGKSSTWYSRQMAFLGSWLMVFIGIHMYHFWAQMHWGDLPVDAHGHKDLYLIVATAFKQEMWIVVFYVLSCIVLAFHLIHGFQSSFQTLGLNNKKYTPFIKAVGWVFAVVVCGLFAAMPIYFQING